MIDERRTREKTQRRRQLDSGPDEPVPKRVVTSCVAPDPPGTASAAFRRLGTCRKNAM